NPRLASPTVVRPTGASRRVLDLAAPATASSKRQRGNRPPPTLARGVSESLSANTSPKRQRGSIPLNAHLSFCQQSPCSQPPILPLSAQLASRNRSDGFSIVTSVFGGTL